jgi:hypothetical protein
MKTKDWEKEFNQRFPNPYIAVEGSGVMVGVYIKAFIHQTLSSEIKREMKVVEELRKHCLSCDNDEEEQDPCNYEYNQAISDVLKVLKEKKGYKVEK